MLYPALSCFQGRQGSGKTGQTAGPPRAGELLPCRTSRQGSRCGQASSLPIPCITLGQSRVAGWRDLLACRGNKLLFWHSSASWPREASWPLRIGHFFSSLSFSSGVKSWEGWLSPRVEAMTECCEGCNGKENAARLAALQTAWYRGATVLQPACRYASCAAVCGRLPVAVAEARTSARPAPGNGSGRSPAAASWRPRTDRPPTS